jgi:conjugative transfer signal peptidase TraF
MGQPVLMATLALAIAAVLTAAIAIGTSADRRASRVVRLSVASALIAVAAVALEHEHLRINFTDSMPIGIYLLSPFRPDRVKRGMLVAACPPARAANIGRQRGYLAAGPCVNDTELVLKAIAGAPDDEVQVTSAGLVVNALLLPHTRPVRRDRSGRPLAQWPRGRYRLTSGQVWLYAADDRSWDSRYWGPASVRDLKAVAVPLLIAPGGASP